MSSSSGLDFQEFQVIKKAVDQKFSDLMDIAEKYCGPLDIQVHIKSPVEMKQVAGKALYRKNEIWLNGFFLKTEFDDMINNTLAHELAHFVQKTMFPRAKQAHGPEWKRIMRNLFNTEPTTYHTYSTRQLVKNGVIRRERRFEYTCDCNQSYNISATRHGKMQRGTTNYFCKSCKSNLKFVKPL